MAVTFNPLNPFGLDFTGSGSNAIASKYVRTFNATTDWGSPSGGLYSIIVLASVHNKGITPSVQVYELVSGNYQLVQPDSIIVNASGDVTITTLQTPNTRFAGSIVII